MCILVINRLTVQLFIWLLYLGQTTDFLTKNMSLAVLVGQDKLRLLDGVSAQIYTGRKAWKDLAESYSVIFKMARMSQTQL